MVRATSEKSSCTNGQKYPHKSEEDEDAARKLLKTQKLELFPKKSDLHEHSLLCLISCVVPPFRAFDLFTPVFFLSLLPPLHLRNAFWVLSLRGIITSTHNFHTTSTNHNKPTEKKVPEEQKAHR